MKHPDDEVYVSRISPRMAEYIAPHNAHQREFIRFGKGHSDLLQAYCIFCEKSNSFQAHYYVDHYRSHTGEYTNLCAMCNQLCSFATHCGISTTNYDDFDIYTQDMMAYRCKECNYVQIKREKVDEHLRKHHGIVDAIDGRIQEFQLLPAFRTMIKQNNPNNSTVQGE